MDILTTSHRSQTFQNHQFQIFQLFKTYIFGMRGSFSQNKTMIIRYDKENSKERSQTFQIPNSKYSNFSRPIFGMWGSFLPNETITIRWDKENNKESSKK
ncbi:hypothetical protein Avbf_01045 [Armadillidium vulgare]|nr:hypothetical protein Avbf_01045 [Armadillidium vulgare]